jgi:hypothetical protein
MQADKMELANLLYNYDNSGGFTTAGQSADGNNELKEKIYNKIEESDMTPLYERLCEKYGWNVNTSLLDVMK